MPASLNNVKEVALAIDYCSSIFNNSYLRVVAFLFIKDSKSSSATVAIIPSNTTHIIEHIQ